MARSFIHTRPKDWVILKAIGVGFETVSWEAWAGWRKGVIQAQVHRVTSHPIQPKSRINKQAFMTNQDPFASFKGIKAPHITQVSHRVFIYVKGRLLCLV